MTVVSTIVRPLPLPSKVTAKTGKELKKKVEFLAEMHGPNFLISLAQDVNGRKVSEIIKK